jgi:hypothetical protein
MKLTRTFAIHFIASLFIFLFTYTAISKFLEFSKFTRVLESSPLIGNSKIGLAWLLPLMELATAFLLFFPKSRAAGLYASLFLMVMFTLYIGGMLLFASELPCSCGGVIAQLSWKQHLVLNILLLVAAGLGIHLQRLEHKQQPNYLLQ